MEFYGIKVWKMNQTAANILERWERKIVRRIFGGIKSEEGSEEDKGRTGRIV